MLDGLQVTIAASNVLVVCGQTFSAGATLTVSCTIISMAPSGKVLHIGADAIAVIIASAPATTTAATALGVLSILTAVLGLTFNTTNLTSMTSRSSFLSSASVTSSLAYTTTYTISITTASASPAPNPSIAPLPAFILAVNHPSKSLKRQTNIFVTSNGMGGIFRAAGRGTLRGWNDNSDEHDNWLFATINYAKRLNQQWFHCRRVRYIGLEQSWVY